MGKLIVYMTMSLDGYIAADGDDRPGLGLGVGGEPLHRWLAAGNRDSASSSPQKRANAEVLDEMLSTGAVVAGRRFLELVDYWGGNHHDDVPIFVLSHDPPSKTRRGNLHFVDDPARAVSLAKDAAGGRDVMMHGASAVQAVLELGLVDELVITIAPLLLNRGRRLFDNLPPATTRLQLIDAVQGVDAVHLRYRFDDAVGRGATSEVQP